MAARVLSSAPKGNTTRGKEGGGRREDALCDDDIHCLATKNRGGKKPKPPPRSQSYPPAQFYKGDVTNLYVWVAVVVLSVVLHQDWGNGDKQDCGVKTQTVAAA